MAEQQYIHLQSLGRVKAKPASELKVGDLLSWNYAYKEYQVKSIRDISPKSIEIIEVNINDGKEYKIRLLKKRLVASD
jgi:hypothetical protein